MTATESKKLGREIASDTFNNVCCNASTHRKLRQALRGKWDEVYGSRMAVEYEANVMAFNEAAKKRWSMLSREWKRDDDVWADDDKVSAKK